MSLAVNPLELIAHHRIAELRYKILRSTAGVHIWGLGREIGLMREAATPYSATVDNELMQAIEEDHRGRP